MRCIRARAFAALILAALPWPSPAAGSAPFAAPALDLPGTGGGLLRVTLSLLFVIGAVLVTAWLSRRLRGMSGPHTNALTVLAHVSLGARERAVLVRVGARQLLLGVAPGSVRTLHLLEEQALPAADTESAGAERPTFKSMLLKSLGR